MDDCRSRKLRTRKALARDHDSRTRSRSDNAYHSCRSRQFHDFKARRLHARRSGVTKSHSRPHVSNDNPHIESLFKTTKYQPQFPATFTNIVEARSFCRAFYAWYNNEHRHSGIALLTPSDVHHGRVEEKTARRQAALDAAYAAHPERFVKGRPKPLQIEPAAYINRPAAIDKSEAA
jgi:transposase InsO family protein